MEQNFDKYVDEVIKKLGNDKYSSDTVYMGIQCLFDYMGELFIEDTDEYLKFIDSIPPLQLIYEIGYTDAEENMNYDNKEE